MAGRGAAPKTTASRDRDMARRQNKQGLVDDGEMRGPELPDDMEWHPRTVKWWNTWRRSPLAQTWLDTDWDFLLDTALMHDAMWGSGRWDFAAELRLRVAKLGATIEDRQRLRISIETEAKEDAGLGTIMQLYKEAAAS